MITLIEGLAGSGKTWLMARLLKKRWEKGEKIYSNFSLWFDDERTNVDRWHNLDECTYLKKGILCIDESQKFLDARRWKSLPVAFTELIAMHRHHHLDIYTTTQDFSHIDIRVRQNVHELLKCNTVIRIPRNQNTKPILQIIRVDKKEKIMGKDGIRSLWRKSGKSKLYYISKYWTKTYYNTYGDVGQDRFICKITQKKTLSQKKGSWQAKIVSRELIDSGKKRL